MADTHVVMTDGNPQRMQVACSIPGVSFDQFYFSESLSVAWGGVLFPKRRSPVVEKLYKAYNWAFDFDLPDKHSFTIQDG